MASLSANKPGLFRTSTAAMLLAVLALVLHGVLAPMARSQMLAAHAPGHDHCAGHATGATAALPGGHADHASHDVAGRVELTPVSSSPMPLDAFHQAVCCTAIVTAILPQPLLVSRGGLVIRQALLPSASLLPPGVSPEGPRKPPRGRAQA